MNSRILPTLALFVAVGIFFAYVQPTWSGPVATTRTAIQSNEKTLAAAREYAKKQNDLASARNTIDADSLRRLEVFLPESVNNVGLILDINALAARSGISLANIDILREAGGATSAAGAQGTSGASPSIRQNPVSSVDLTLSALGTYGALQSFLAGLEKSARLLDVQDISVKGSDTGVYNYQMTVRLYWLR